MVNKPRKYRPRKSKKRVYRKKQKLLNVSIFPLPRQTYRKLKYIESFSLDSGVGSVLASYTFSCNGLYDPNITSVGHQPYGFDQMMNFYNHYEVVASQIKVTMADSNATNAMAMICRVDANGNLITSNAQLAMEQPDTKKVIFNPSEAHRTVIKQSWTQKKYFGSRKSGADTLCGTAGQNPAEQSYYIIGLASVDPLANAAALFVTVEIDYVARFFEPLELTSS